ncbi:MAG: acyl-CoA thioesterase [Cognaticolwellia sp.]
MSDFQSALNWAPIGENIWSGGIDDTWRQGRAAYGGLLAAHALKAMQAIVAQARPARSLQVVFVAPPKEGVLKVQSTPLREGRNVSLAQARITQGEHLILSATAAFGADRLSDIQVEPKPAPSFKAPDACMPLPFLPGMTPNFTQHLDYRWVEGGFPYSGHSTPGITGYCRHKTRVDDPALALVGLADAWPAPILPLAKGPAPASSVTWNLQLLQLPQVPQAAWWTMIYDADQAQAGMSTVTGRLYAPDGSLAAISTQLTVVFDKR